jgi:hypothetical protein
MGNGYLKALAFWTIGIQYLHLVQAVSNEICQSENIHILISDEPISIEQYDEKTKWSDHALILPLLFNFYHGLEVLLKGFLSTRGLPLEKSHKLSELLKKFKDEYPTSNLIPFFEKYIEQAYLPSILSDFCNSSNITIDEYYQALKYGEATSGRQYQHLPLKYKDKEGVSFFSDLKNDIELIRKESVNLEKQMQPK